MKAQDAAAINNPSRTTQVGSHLDDVKGPNRFPVTRITAANTPYNIAADDYLVVVDTFAGAVDVNLPDIVGQNGRVLVIQKSSKVTNVLSLRALATPSAVIDSPENEFSEESIVNFTEAERAYMMLIADEARLTWWVISQGGTFDGGPTVDPGPVFQGFIPANNNDFSWANQGGASVAVRDTVITLTAPNTDSTSFNYRVRYKSAPATPWTLVVYQDNDVFDDESFLKAGVLFRESSSGKFEIMEFEGPGGNGPVLRINDMASPTSNAGGGQVAARNNLGFKPNWFRIGDNGTNRTFEISYDGIHWAKAFADRGRTTFLTANQIGFAVDNANSTTGIPNELHMSIYHWVEA